MEQRKLHSSQAAYRRQRQIEDCLFENLQHVPYQSISVSDLCRQVGISRKAFYNYYPDKDACFCAIVDRLIRESMLRSAAVSSEDSLMENVMVMLDFWKNQKNFFDIMMRNSLYHYFLLRNIDYVMKEDRSILELLSTPEVQSDMDILACYVASTITLVLQWYFRGFNTSTEEMARKLLRLLHAPMFSHNET